MEQKDPYRILGVSRQSPHEEIRAAYKKLAQKMHPDKNGGVGHAEWESVQWAHGILSNDKARELWDACGMEDTEDRIDIEATNQILRMFNQWLESVMKGKTPYNDDCITGMARSFSREISNHAIELSNVENRLAQLDKMIGRFDMPDDELLSPIEETLQQRKKAETRHKMQVEFSRKVFTRASELLRGCSYSPEGGLAVPQQRVVIGSTGTATTTFT